MGRCRPALEIADDAVDGLDVPPLGGRVVVVAGGEEDLAGLRGEFPRERFPGADTKHDNRYSGK